MKAQSAQMAADEIASAIEKGHPLERLSPNCVPNTLEEAYAVQDRLLPLLGEPCGYKIGFTNPEIQTRFGLGSPVSGRLISERIHASPAQLAAGDLLMLAVEPEIAFRLHTPLPPTGAPYETSQLMDAIDGVYPALEIVESRIAHWETVGSLLAIADNAWGSHWVYGERVSAWTPEELVEQEIVAHVDGQEICRGSGANVLDSPLDALQWLTNHLALRGRTLHAGEFITTGSCTAVIEPHPGSRVTADFGRLGSVEVRFQI